MKLLLFSIFSVFFFGKLDSSWASPVNNCSNGWKEVDWKLVPFIELNARYFSYAFKIPKGKKLNFKIEGTFPYARYISFHTYNQETEDPTSHLTDFNIVANPGSVNPFQPGVDRYNPNRQFTVWVSPSADSFTNEQKLILPFDEKRDRFVDIWFRVYASETEKVELPTIYALDDSLNPTACPELSKKEWSLATEPGPFDFRIPSEEQQKKAPMPFKNGDVHFFRPSTSTLGANMDNHYLSTRLDGKAILSPYTLKGRLERRLLKKHHAILNIGNITAFTFQVPSFPDTKAKLKYFTGQEDVRYWSICLSGEDTYTSGCIMDSDAKTFVGEDGKLYATFVVGPNDASLKSKLKSAGYNYLDHSQHRIPILFYRQMLSADDFEGKIEKVKSISPVDSQNEDGLFNFFGETHIGKYSPLGRQCWLTSDFMSTFCGLK